MDVSNPPAPSQSTESVFTGRWIANVQGSLQHPANRFRRAFIDISVEGDVMRFKHAFIDSGGRAEHGENELTVDGRVHVENGYGLTAEWRGPRAFETVATKDGVVVGRGSYEVSVDGTTLTISSPEQRLVLQRS